MDFDWKSIVGEIAPGIATVFGGPLAGMAVKTLARELLGDENASEDDLAAAIQSGGPEIALKIREADHKFAIEMKNAGVKLEEIAMKDRDSARRREIKVKDRTPAAMGTMIIAGFFGIMFTLVFIPLPAGVEKPFLVLLGALGWMVKDVVGYYFGSSAGSKQKTDALTEAAKKA